MKLMLDEQRTMSAARTPRLQVLPALSRTAAGVGALFALCMFGPAIVEYGTMEGLAIPILVPLTSLSRSQMLTWCGLQGGHDPVEALDRVYQKARHSIQPKPPSSDTWWSAPRQA